MIISRSHKIVILSLVMILVLLTTWTIAPLSSSRAVLAGVTVVGEVVMTLATLASLMMIALGASGMDGALRNQAAATGTQPLTYVGQLLNRWLSSAATDMGFSLLAQKMQQGLSYLPDGTLYLDSEATAAVADFQRWAWDVDGGNLEQYANVSSGGGVLSNGGLSAYPLDCTSGPISYQSVDYYYDSSPVLQNSTQGYYAAYALYGGRIYCLGLRHGSNARMYVAVPDNPFRAGLTNARFGTVPSGMSRTFDINDVDTWVLLWSTTAASNWSYNIDMYDPGISLDSYTLPVLSTFGGADEAIGDPDTFVGPMQQGNGTQLPLANTVSVSAEAAAQLHFDNYLRAAAAAYAGTGTASVPVTDVGSGDEDTLPLSVPLDTPIGVTGVTDTTIDQSGSVAGSDAVATDFEGLDEYTMDLTQFFPFCVPFDLVYLFEKLRADPEALVIDWHFIIPYLDVDIPIEIDLSPFDSIAQLLRSLEVISFVVALMIGTKNLIQGGD